MREWGARAQLIISKLSQDKNWNFDHSLFEKLILKSVYNLKIDSEFSVHFSPAKKRIQLNLTVFSAEEKRKIQELLDSKSQLSQLVQKITNSKMVMLEESKHKDHLTVFIDNLPQEGNKHKFDYEKMEFTTAFYHALINNQDLTIDSITEAGLVEYYSTIAQNQKALTRELGYKLLTDFLEYERESLSDEWAYLVGKTKYFFSYNQNLLEHLLEVSTLSANFAFQLGLDSLKAKRAAFFHDIGKVTGQYSDHVTDGVNLAIQFKLEEYIKETIETHHNYEHSGDNPYLIITRAMDKLSAGRLGARPLQLEKTQERNEKINSLLSSISEISKLEFLAGGHIIKVYLRPESFQWDSLEELKKKISSMLKEAELKYQYNYQFILRLEYSDSFLLNDY